ncbi:MAG: enediyne biosynthesis protein UnbU [Pyrinomonadaceae bacterium]|nr:enediyne biosynthesis protein UnbU [Pyrinomonadaceae bacterium]
MSADNNRLPNDRLGGLRRFAVAITVLNILGHTVLGFEQSLMQPLVALAAGYSTEILLELVQAWSQQRRPQFMGGYKKLVDFLLPAHISGLAVAMLLYANERLWPVAFATAVAIGSKAIFRAPVGRGVRHFYNPSNFGISVTLLLFTWVGIAPPYHFTENLDRIGDWLLPGIIIVTGSFLNWRFTHKLPLIAGWLGGFVVQAIIRSWLFDTPLVAALLPMTGMAFILYTFYMVTDPATTPQGKLSQIFFGAGVAATYGLLMASHIVFGLFFALTIVCTVRGLGLYARAWMAHRSRSKLSAGQTPAPVVARGT